MRILKRSTELLACELTPAEFEMRAGELAETVEAYAAEITLQTAAKADMKAKLTELDRKRDDLAKVVARRKEDRLVDVELHADDVKGMVGWVRMDTGQTYSERPLQAAERQVSFLPDGEGAPDGSAGGVTTVTLTSGGSSVTTTPERMRKALDEVKASRSARTSITH